MSRDHLRPGRKDVKDFIAFAKEHNFELVGRTGNGHFRIKHHPSGQAYTIPASPSCSRWAKNAKAHVIRVNRQHQENQ